MTSSRPLSLAALFAASLLGCSESAAVVNTSATALSAVLYAADLQFVTKPSGVRVAVLYGDPTQAGPFGLRLQYPAGYAKGPHYHPKDAFVTVLRGAYYRAYGTDEDRSRGIHLVAGTFSVNPARVSHYEWVEEPAELEVHAEGPWGTVYVDDSGAPIEGEGGDACGGGVCEASGHALPVAERRPTVLKPEELQWRPRPGGDEVAVLFGDPQRPGPFVLRVRSPGGTREDPHTHPQDAFVTVLSGGFRFGIGNRFTSDDSVPVSDLDMLRVPGGLPHFRSAAGPGVVEIRATGPWGTTKTER